MLALFKIRSRFALPSFGLVLLFCCVGLLAGSANADDKSDDKIKVLIVDGQNNHGDWPKITAMLKQYLETTNKFSVDIERTKFTYKGDKWLEDFGLDDKEYEAHKKAKADPDFSPDFSKYHVVVSNFGHGAADWPEKTQAAFTKFVSDGGGFVSVHAADNSFPGWKEEIVRDDSKGSGGRHGPQHEFSLVVRDAEHPIMKGLPKTFLHAKDELYERLRGPAVNMRVLATALAAKKFRGSGRHEPTLMTIDFGKGRIFHSTLGHAPYSCECVAFMTTFLRGTEWAATGEVTVEVPKDFPTQSKSSSRKFELAPAGEEKAGEKEMKKAG